jgi:flavin reductase (DIM6/NTAB) family NADH-FMN oxidoreductase RutF
VLVGCAEGGGWQQGSARPNLITIAWAGIVCSKPPMVSIAIRPERYSHGLVKRSGEFTVNLVGEPLLYAMDYCGVKSGRDMDKFAALGLTAIPAVGLATAPALGEAPAYLSCKVVNTLSLGTHELFIAEIVEVCVRDGYFLPDGSIDERAMALVAYVHGKYRALGDELAFYGHSVASDEVLARRMPNAKRPDRKAGGNT